MKRIGLLGGMSWESTAIYYRLVNREVNRRLGGLHSAQVLLESVDFEKISAWQKADDWALAAGYLSQRARALQNAGADCIVICTNTMHKIYGEIQSSVSIPVLCIIDATALYLQQNGIKTAGILGTNFTMTQPFYASKYLDKFDITLMPPGEEQRQHIHRIIFEELCKGDVSDTSRGFFLSVIQSLHEQGCQGVILGCTEIGMLITQQDTPIPIIDTTAIHALSAVDWALSNPS